MKPYFIIIPLVALIGILGSMSAYYLGLTNSPQVSQSAQVTQPIFTLRDSASSTATSSSVTTEAEAPVQADQEAETESVGFLDETYEAFPAPEAAPITQDLSENNSE